MVSFSEIPPELGELRCQVQQAWRFGRLFKRFPEGLPSIIVLALRAEQADQRLGRAVDSLFSRVPQILGGFAMAPEAAEHLGSRHVVFVGFPVWKVWGFVEGCQGFFRTACLESRDGKIQPGASGIGHQFYRPLQIWEGDFGSSGAQQARPEAGVDQRMVRGLLHAGFIEPDRLNDFSQAEPCAAGREQDLGLVTLRGVSQGIQGG